jgi:hypothetical protein
MEPLTDEEKAKTLAGAPSPITVKDRTFLVDKANTSQAFTINEWAIERVAKSYNPFKDVCDALKDLPVSDFQKCELLRQAHQVKMSGEIPIAEMSRCLRSKEGVAFQLFVFTRKHHAELTLEQCNDLVDESNRVDTYVAIDEACGGNTLNKAMISAGFFQPAPAQSTG